MQRRLRKDERKLVPSTLAGGTMPEMFIMNDVGRVPPAPSSRRLDFFKNREEGTSRRLFRKKRVSACPLNFSKLSLPAVGLGRNKLSPLRDEDCLR
jgi:hypothetical protein